MAHEDRPPFSHVNADGTAKRTLMSEREAITWAAELRAETGREFGWYVCNQRPEHWHVAKVRPEERKR